MRPGCRGGTSSTASAPKRDPCLGAVITTYVQLVADHSDLCAVLVTYIGRVARMPIMAEGIRTAFQQPVRQLLHAGADDGLLRVAEDEMTAPAIIGEVIVVGLHQILTGRPVDPPAMSQRLDGLILHGLAPTQARKNQ